MSATKGSEEQKHVAFLAFPFGSHPLTRLSLLRKLARAAPNVRFSFLNTAKSTRSLLSKSTADDDVPHNIKFFQVADGVPEPEGHVHAKNPVEAINLFLKATPDNLRKGIDMAVAETGQRITCLLCDAFLSTSAMEIAEDLNVPWIPIWSSLPWCLSAHVYTDIIRERCVGSETTTVDFIPGLSAMRVADLPAEVLLREDEEESLFSRALSQMGSALPRATAVVMGFFEELNSPPLNHDLKSKFQNVFNVGFLTLSLPAPPLPPSSSDLTGCLSWLDGKCKSPLIFKA